MRYYIKAWRLPYLPLVLTLVLAVIGLVGLRQWADQQTEDVLSPLLFQRAIVIDAGHGGFDPGVVGVAGTLEKDICLEVAQKLAELLRAGGAEVAMTREQDLALAERKAGDLQERVRLTEELQPAAFISIHGNSFPSSPSSKGAQVFYYNGNAEGQRLAETIQTSLAEQLGNTERLALKHQSAYILKHIELPAVVVELGFLSNAAEEQLLNDEDYQWRLAWAIYGGLLDYLSGEQQPAASTAE